MLRTLLQHERMTCEIPCHLWTGSLQAVSEIHNARGKELEPCHREVIAVNLTKKSP